MSDNRFCKKGYDTSCRFQTFHMFISADLIHEMYLIIYIYIYIYIYKDKIKHCSFDTIKNRMECF